MSGQVSSRLGDIAGFTGRRAFRIALYVIELTSFIAYALRDWWRRGHLRNPATRQALVGQVIFTGIDAVAVILLIALAIGVSLTPTLLMLGRSFGSDAQLADLLVRAIGVELGPLLTAIILIGRSGSAVAVDLGSMKLRGEVEALHLLGINMNDFFVAPRLLGAALAQFVLATYFTAIALFGGVFISGVLVSSSHLTLLGGLGAAIQPLDVLVFTVKNLLFGLIVAGTACFSALKVEHSPTEVPQRTQQAIVNGQLLVFIINGVFAVALL